MRRQIHDDGAEVLFGIHRRDDRIPGGGERVKKFSDESVILDVGACIVCKFP